MFYTLLKTIFSELNLTDPLKMLSICKSLKFCCLVENYVEQVITSLPNDKIYCRQQNECDRKTEMCFFGVKETLWD